MNKDIERLSAVRLMRHKKRNIWVSAVFALAVLVLCISVYKLIQPASATTRDLKNYITSVSEKGDITYDVENDYYVGDCLEINFKLPNGVLSSNCKDFTYNYPEGIQIKDSILNQDYTLYDSRGITAGTYKFVSNDNGTYAVNINFNDVYVKNNDGGAVSGSVHFSSIYNKKTTQNGTSISVKFKDDLSIEIPLDRVVSKYDLSTKKTGSLSADKKTIEYTVLVCSLNGTPDVVSFEDVLKVSGSDAANATFAGVTVKSVKVNYYDDSNYHIASENGQVSTNSFSYNNGVISMILPKLEPAKKASNGSNMVANGYKITYSYNLDIPVDSFVTVRNDVKTSSKDQKTGKYYEDSDSYSFTIDRRNTVSKSGYGLSKDRASWTIYVNNNNSNIAGQVLTDDMFKGYDLRDLKVYPDYGYEVLYENNEVAGIKFKGFDNGTNTLSYTITYTTNYKSGDGATHNTAYFGKKEASADAWKPSDTPTNPGTPDEGKPKVSKKASDAVMSADPNVLNIAWETNIDVPSTGIPEGTTITDKLGYYDKSRQYYTYRQILDIYNTLTTNSPWKDKVYDFKVMGYKRIGEQLDWTQNWFTVDQLSEDVCNQYYITTFTYNVHAISQQEAKSLKLYYYSSADVSYSDKIAYLSNEYTLGNYTASGQYSYQKASFVKTDEAGNPVESVKTNDSGTLVWKVDATLDSLSKYKSATISDFLPKGTELESLYIKYEYIEGCIDISRDEIPTDGTEVSGTLQQNRNCDYTLSYDKESGKIVLTLTPADKSVLSHENGIHVTFNCKVNTSAIDDYVKGNTYSFTNYATFKFGDLVFDDSQTQYWQETYEVVKKGGTFDDVSQRIHYSIRINENADDLVEGSDTLTLEDCLSYIVKENKLNRDISLVPSSVKLYKATTDEAGEVIKEEVTDFTWEYNVFSTATDEGELCTKTITATIPDSTYLIFEYDYIVSGNFKDVSGSTLGVKNTATITGTAYSSTDEKEYYEWSKANHGAVVTGEYQYRFYKVEKGNYGKTLPGAEFTVYRYSDDSATDYTYTSDNEGYFSIQYTNERGNVAFRQDRLYYIMETKAPKGYRLDQSIKYYFYFDEDGDYKVPEGISAVNLMKCGTTAFIENEVAPTSIEVSKEWYNGDGYSIEPYVDSIYVELHRVDTFYDDLSAHPAELVTTVELNKSNNWHYIFNDLESYSYHNVDGVTKSYRYKYYVIERAVEGYEWRTTDEQGISVGTAIEKGSVVLKNYAVKYELPETGGSGRRGPLTWIGIIFILITMVGIIYKRQKYISSL